LGAEVFIEGRRVEATEGQTLFQCASVVGIPVPTSCFEQGKCRECLIEVEEGADLLSAPTTEEQHLGEGYRLSCRAAVTGKGRIRFRTMRRGDLQIVESAESLEGDFAELDPVARRDDPGPLLGVALDVGTTTVVARLHDLRTGEALATHSFENPQRFGGSDVMARIHYDTVNKGRLLQRTLLGYLKHSLESFPCNADDIFEIVVAGNTTMRDLFFGLDVEPIGVRPYRSTTEGAGKTSLDIHAQKLRLPVNREARVYGLPLIRGHIGADAAAGLLVSGIADGAGVSVFMDIGTNTELVAGNRDKLMAASCPAGPAFEGGRIVRGMPALPGAIERVRMTEEGAFECKVIEGVEPVGICGSGLVDLMSELLRTGCMNEQGRFEDEFEGRVILDDEEQVFVSEADVNELAQAKGANVAGLCLLLAELGVSFEDVERVFLAGGFARHLDLDAARRIGLIPDLPSERFVQLGNTSLEGASWVLRSAAKRRELEAMVCHVEHVELEVQPDFFDAFVDGCQFVRFGGSSNEEGSR